MPKESKPKRKEKDPPRKYHPKYVAAARELCARYLEEVQAGRFLPEAATAGKYDVSRQIGFTGGTPVPQEITDTSEGFRLLDAA